MKKHFIALFLTGVCANWVNAAVLPEERADASYDYYSGGGVEVHGPTMLVRKNIKEKYAISANYHIDEISSASIDVVTQASPYSETREEFGVGGSWLESDTLISVSVSKSDEPDYKASTYSVGITQDMWDGLFTLAMGYSRGDDRVSRSDTEFEDTVDRHLYRLGGTLILSPTWLASVNYEATAEEGFLSNPYRGAILRGAPVLERYPRTRTGHATALGSVKHLGNQSAFKFNYRYFNDTWDIDAHTVELTWAKRFSNALTLDLSYRFYTQTAASFYADNAPVFERYLARDKELSAFDSHELGMTLKFAVAPILGFKSSQVGFAYSFITFDYANFTDLRDDELYEFHANVVQLYYTGWF